MGKALCTSAFYLYPFNRRYLRDHRGCSGEHLVNALGDLDPIAWVVTYRTRRHDFAFENRYALSEYKPSLLCQTILAFASFFHKALEFRDDETTPYAILSHG